MNARTVLMAIAGLLVVSHSFTVVGEAQPGPEQKKLDYFVGKWKVDVDVKPSATLPASKASGTEDCQWFANLHVVCRSESTGAAGLYTAMRVISYVPALKQYSSYTVDSLGYAVLALGQVQGETWTFSTDTPTLKTRYVVKGAKDSYTAVAEYAGADGKWIQSSEIKSARMK